MSTYRVGRLNDPREDDPAIEDKDAAMQAACEMSDGDFFSSVIAVWLGDGSGEIVAIVYEGQVFSS